MQGEAHLEIGIQRLKCGSIFLFVDGIKPHSLGQRLRFKHRRVMRCVSRSKSRRKRADTLFAVNLQIEDADDQRIARLGPINIERAR